MAKTAPPAPPPAAQPAKKKLAARLPLSKSPSSKTAAANRLAKTPWAKVLLTRHFFSIEPVATDYLPQEEAEAARTFRVIRGVSRNAIIIAVLTLLIVFLIPFTQPLNIYYALAPESKVTQMVSLPQPNLTNAAVIGWAANTVTEVLSIGFGDFDEKLLQQKKRFTREGWAAFVKSFLKEEVDQSFRKHRLVLTTVPSDTPVIVSQGLNLDHVYEWKVQVPVIMNYTTNNNVSQPSRSMLELTIVRVPYTESSSGLAIDVWHQTRH